MSLKSLISLPLKEAQLLLQSELKIPNFKCWKLKKPSRFSSFSIRARFFCDYIRDRYDSKLESAINQQINAELNAGYAYLNIATYYGRSDVAMPGLHGFFMKMFYEELEHGLAFVKFQNLRGGCVQYCPLETHKKSEWKDIPAVFMTALSMEKHVKGLLLAVHGCASQANDVSAQDYLEEFITGQEKSIQEMARYYTRACKLVKSDSGLYLFDRELYETHVKKSPAKCTAEIGPELYS